MGRQKDEIELMAVKTPCLNGNAFAGLFREYCGYGRGEYCV
jgi:hypothetical protein